MARRPKESIADGTHLFWPHLTPWQAVNAINAVAWITRDYPHAFNPARTVIMLEFQPARIFGIRTPWLSSRASGVRIFTYGTESLAFIRFQRGHLSVNVARFEDIYKGLTASALWSTRSSD